MRNHFDESYYYGGVYLNYDDFLDWPKVARELIRDFQFDSFLDIGCGCGNLVKEIRRQRSATDGWGVDIGEFAIRKANTDFVILADCNYLPFKDNRFDMVHILGTFSYIPTIAGVKYSLKEAYRVAKKTILFDDVYIHPDRESDDYDPYRARVLSQGEWLALWHDTIDKDTQIITRNDELIIKRYA